MMVEGLTRLHGYAGLRDGFRLLHALVERHWDGLHPAPDEDGLATRLRPITGLNGEGAEGTLIRPIRKIPLIRGQQGDYALWQIIQAGEVAALDDDRRQQRLAAGAQDLDAVTAAAQAMDATEVSSGAGRHRRRPGRFPAAVPRPGPAVRRGRPRRPRTSATCWRRPATPCSWPSATAASRCGRRSAHRPAPPRPSHRRHVHSPTVRARGARRGGPGRRDPRPRGCPSPDRAGGRLVPPDGAAGADLLHAAGGGAAGPPAAARTGRRIDPGRCRPGGFSGGRRHQVPRRVMPRANVSGATH